MNLCYNLTNMNFLHCTFLNIWSLFIRHFLYFEIWYVFLSDESMDRNQQEQRQEQLHLQQQKSDLPSHPTPDSDRPQSKTKKKISVRKFQLNACKQSWCWLHFNITVLWIWKAECHWQNDWRCWYFVELILLSSADFISWLE